MIDSLNDFPDEIILRIFHFIDFLSIENWRLVSPRFRNITTLQEVYIKFENAGLPIVPKSTNFTLESPNLIYNMCLPSFKIRWDLLAEPQFYKLYKSVTKYCLHESTHAWYDVFMIESIFAIAEGAASKFKCCGYYIDYVIFACAQFMSLDKMMSVILPLSLGADFSCINEFSATFLNDKQKTEFVRLFRTANINHNNLIQQFI